MNKEQEYVEQEGIRNSELGYFISSPALYKDYIIDNNKPELNESFFSLGSMVHCGILEQDELWNRFIFSKYPNPKSAPQKKFVDRCIFYLKEGLTDIQLIIQDALQLSYVTGKLSEKEKETKAQKLYEEFKERISFYIENKEKTILPIRELIRFKKCINSIKNHKAAKILLSEDYHFTANEFPIYWKFNTLKMKSKLDRIIINKETKTITLIDIKTTGFPLHKFKESFINFDYEREMSIYIMAIDWLINNNSNFVYLKDYECKIKLIVVETTGYFETTVLTIPEEKIFQRISILHNETLPNLEWHYKQNEWKFSKEYYLGNGEFELKYETNNL